MEQPTWIGRTLSGRYKIDAMLGQGGMSAVYKATDPNLKRVVAVKLIHSHLSSDPTFILRFESEASAVASLRHSNIVQVYDFNNDNGVYYMILEFIPGETLQDRMKRLVTENHNLPLEDILNITINISDAVGYAHQRGMVHRDIKPANIMLDLQSQAILMDFGIVKILGGENHTSTGAVVGTARYMSPEIIRGEVADHRSDIYSLGITLYEMLSGHPPFVSDSAMTLMMMHLNEPVPDVRGFRSDISPQIVEILEKCLAKNREDRYQSAAELSTDLRHSLVYIGGQATNIRVSTEPRVATARGLETKAVGLTQDNPASVQTTSATPPPYSPNTSTAYPTPASSSGSFKLLRVFGIGLAASACFAISFFLGGMLFNTKPPQQTGLPSQSAQLGAVPIITEYPSAPVIAPEIAVSLATATPRGPYVVITFISLQNDSYVVDYEVYDFTDSLHVHMFFDTVPPQQAGSPSTGPWKMTWGEYGDPPFTEYTIANRSRSASQMCALVANTDHSVVLGSGNCVDLP